MQLFPKKALSLYLSFFTTFCRVSHSSDCGYLKRWSGSFSIKLIINWTHSTTIWSSWRKVFYCWRSHARSKRGTLLTHGYYQQHTNATYNTIYIGVKIFRGGGCSQLAGLLNTAADHKMVDHLTAVSNTLHRVHVHVCMHVCVCWGELCFFSS